MSISSDGTVNGTTNSLGILTAGCSVDNWYIKNRSMPYSNHVGIRLRSYKNKNRSMYSNIMYDKYNNTINSSVISNWEKSVGENGY